MDYSTFLDSKRVVSVPVGFDPPADSSPALFGFQRAIVEWACRRGRAAIFAGCGLGKTLMELQWAEFVRAYTGKDVLILTPLAVARQFGREAEKFGFSVNVCRTGSDARPGINVTNYERLHHFSPDSYAGIVIDESSCLKALDSKTRKSLSDFSKPIPYRLAATATPAPNETIELQNHAEFLDVMSQKEMLATFFIQDGNSTQKWRLKGHAEEAFWKWLASWAVAVRKPSDLGFSDAGFDLPPLRIHEIVVGSRSLPGYLFPMEAAGLSEQRTARKDSLEDRVAAAAEVVNASEGPFLVWCDLNAESEALRKAIPGSVEVRGSDDPQFKEAAVLWFIGDICDCELERCTKKNPEIPAETIEAGLTNKSRPPKTADRPKRTGSTCGFITPQTSTDGNAPANSVTRSTPDAASDIRTTPSFERPQGPLPVVDARSPSETGEFVPRSGSPETTTIGWSKPKAGLVPSAEENRPTAKSSTLTTAMPPESSANFSATTATSGSATSETTPIVQRRRQCTCGGIKDRRVLISKASMFGHGLNLQHCHRMAFVGLSNSYEQVYQAVRRCWRFGQTKPVDCWFVISEAEGAVRANIERKERQAEEMFDSIVRHMKGGMSLGHSARDEMDYRPSRPMVVPHWLSRGA